MRIPGYIAEVIDDLNFTPRESHTGVHYGPDATFANWDDVAALGAKLVELGLKLGAQAKEANNPVCKGTGNDGCNNKTCNKKLVLVGIGGGTWDGSKWVPWDGTGDRPGIKVAPILAIKELRAMSGYGLREAKDIIEAVRAGGTWTYPGEPVDVSKCQFLRFELR